MSDISKKVKKCKVCKGLGKVMSTSESKRVSDCFYCRGKGWRTSLYGRDRS